jgi:hypothetical protein
MLSIVGTYYYNRKRPCCLFCSLAIATLDEGHLNSYIPPKENDPILECSMRNEVRGLHISSWFQLHAAEGDFPGVIQLGFDCTRRD